MIEEERALFLKDKKDKERRVSFIHSLMSKRELYVAEQEMEQKMGVQPQPLSKEEKELQQRLLNLQVDDTPDLHVLEEWRRLRCSTKVRLILQEREDADWKAEQEWAEEQMSFDMANYGDGDGDGCGQEYDLDTLAEGEEENEKDTPPVEHLALSLPALPEDKDGISTETFVMFQPVRIVRGQHTGIKAYFQTFTSKKHKKVSVMLNKDPLQQAIVYHSSITPIMCSAYGCDVHATVPPTTFPYNFDTPLCKEHQH